MEIIKRNGSKETVKLEKISKRIERLCKDLKNVDSITIAQKVVQGLYNGVTSVELDKLATETAYSMSVRHPEYDKLATRLAISTLHKETDSTFSAVVERLHGVKTANGESRPLIAENVLKFIRKNASVLDSAINYDRDYLFDYFGFKTLERSYLMKVLGKVVERPQHMWMRVACGIHSDDVEAALNTYNLLSTMKATHATPTLFNAGTPKNQLSSCFLVAMKDDSIEGIYDTIKEMALISQSAGGIGVHINNIRSKGSPIYGTNGSSNGIIPMLIVKNSTLKFIDQGGNKRKGSAAVYLEPTHPDVFDFLDLRKNNGKEELRARDLNLALWTSDLFFKRVEQDGDWHLMDPNICRGLQDVYDETPEGGSYTDLYNKYVAEGKYSRVVKARDLWAAILTSQIETGQPYILAKDACNRKSNQQNLGTIKSSNLCLSGDTEVLVRNSTSADGNTYLAKLEDVVESVRSGEQLYIQSYDEASGEQTFSKVSEAAMTNPYAEVYKITYHGKEIVCTGDHKVYTKRGWVEAQNLLEEDELLQLNY